MSRSKKLHDLITNKESREASRRGRGAEEEEDAGEVETADGIEAELMEQLPVLKPGEEAEPEELEGKKEELDEEPEETEPSEEEPEEVEECKEGDGVAEVDGSVANGM